MQQVHFLGILQPSSQRRPHHHLSRINHYGFFGFDIDLVDWILASSWLYCVFFFAVPFFAPWVHKPVSFKKCGWDLSGWVPGRKSSVVFSRQSLWRHLFLWDLDSWGWVRKSMDLWNWWTWDRCFTLTCSSSGSFFMGPGLKTKEVRTFLAVTKSNWHRSNWGTQNRGVPSINNHHLYPFVAFWAWWLTCSNTFMLLTSMILNILEIPGHTWCSL